MSYEFVNFRVPIGTKSRLQSLASPHESMTSVLLRAIDLLESAHVNMYVENSVQDTSTLVNRIEFEQVTAQINDLADQITVLLGATRIVDSIDIDLDAVKTELTAQITALNERVSAIEAGCATQLPTFDDTPADNRALYDWATRKKSDGYSWRAIHAAILAAGHKIGNKVDSSRFLPVLQRWAGINESDGVISSDLSNQ